MPPVVQQVGKGVITASRLGFLGVLRLIIKHYYIFAVFIFILPTIVTSIQTGIEENSAYPLPEQVSRTAIGSLTQLSLTLINADTQIDEDVKILRKDPTELMGVKPESGIWKKVKYYWGVGFVFWKIIGNIFLISIPFALAYRYFKYKGKDGVSSSMGQNFRSALLVGLFFIFVMNLILIAISGIDGTLILSFTEGISIYTKVWLVVLKTIPFHGLGNLILYLVGI